MYQANQVPLWQPLTYEAVKELRRTVKEGGEHSPFTMSLLEALADSYVLTPHDWKSLMRMVLTPTQNTEVIIYHYMDDILVAAACDSNLERDVEQVYKAVEHAGLHVSPQKVQKNRPRKHLAWKIMQQEIRP